jgi:hypothetical protein
MTKILIAVAVFVAGGASVTGTAGALDRSGQPSTVVAPMAMAGTMTPASMTVTKKLTIQHVLKGCHVWSDGSRRAATMTLRLKRGTRLTITDMDIDPHKLLQTAGPRLGLRGHMMMGGIESVVFKQAGLYKLTTRTVEMGPIMNAKTIGPDNKLWLTVRVA